jgi:hypothetical protein
LGIGRYFLLRSTILSTLKTLLVKFSFWQNTLLRSKRVSFCTWVRYFCMHIKSHQGAALNWWQANAEISDSLQHVYKRPAQQRIVPKWKLYQEKFCSISSRTSKRGKLLQNDPIYLGNCKALPYGHPWGIVVVFIVSPSFTFFTFYNIMDTKASFTLLKL